MRHTGWQQLKANEKKRCIHGSGALRIRVLYRFCGCHSVHGGTHDGAVESAPEGGALLPAGKKAMQRYWMEN